jgi:hypothetical protein
MRSALDLFAPLLDVLAPLSGAIEITRAVQAERSVVAVAPAPDRARPAIHRDFVGDALERNAIDDLVAPMASERVGLDRRGKARIMDDAVAERFSHLSLRAPTSSRAARIALASRII